MDIKYIMSQMTLEEKVGQLFVARRPQNHDTAMEAVTKYHLGGFTLYACDFENSTLPISMVAKVTCGFFVVLGHVFPIFMKFKGGKGIATTIGVFFVCNWLVALISGALAIVFILLTEIGSMGSFIATTPGAIATCYSVYMTYVLNRQMQVLEILLTIFSNLFIVLIIILTWYAHRKNIERLIAGEEHPTNWLQMIKEHKIKKSLKNKNN